MLYAQRIDIATRLIHWAVDEYQLPKPDFEIVEISAKQVRVKGLSFDDQFSVGTTSVHFSLNQLIKGQVAFVHLDRVKIDASRFEEGVLGYLQKLANGPKSQASSPLILPDITLENGEFLFHRDGVKLESQFSFERLAGADAQFTTKTSGAFKEFAVRDLIVEGRLLDDFNRVHFDLLGGHVEDVSKKLLKPNFSLKGKGQASRETATFDLLVADQKDRFAMDVKGNLDVKLRRLDLDIAIPEVQFVKDVFQPRDITPLAESPLDLDLHLALSSHVIAQPDHVKAEGQLDIKDGYSRKRFNDLEMLFQGETDLKDVIATAEIALAEGEKLKLLTLNTTYDPAQNEARVKLKTQQLDWGRDDLSAEKMSPLLKDVVRFSGRTQASSNLVWKEGRLHGDLAVGLDKFSLSSDQVNIQDITADLTFPTVLPLKTDGVQQINMAEVSSVVTLDDPVIRFGITPGKVQLDQLRAGFLGGQLFLADTQIGLDTSVHETVLHLSDLNLADFFQLIGVEGLSGTGRLDGAIPIRFVKGDFEIVGANLKSQGSGVLNLRSEAAKDMFGHAGEQMALVLEVLSNFHYKSLNLSIDRKLGQNAVFTLGVEGNNPDVKEGYPFKLNINLETNLDKILATLQEGYRLSSQALRYTIGLDK